MQKQKNITITDKSIFSLWFYAFTMLCINFSPFLFNFIWGNHDWLPLISDNSLTSGLIEGRIGQYVLVNIFLMGKILPLLNILLGFIFYSLALIILACYFFKFKILNVFGFITIGMISILPYMSEILYFKFITFSLLSWPLITAVSLLFSARALQKNFILNTFLSTLLLYFALSGYPAAANLYVTATACLFIQKSSELNFKQMLKEILPFILTLISAGILLKLTFTYLQKEHLMMIMYNNNIENSISLLKKIPEVLSNSLLSFVRPQPFFPLSLKIISSIIIGYFVINYLLSAKTFSNFITYLCFLLITLICLKFSAWLIQNNANNSFAQSDPPYYILRTDFFAFPIFLLFCIFSLHNIRSIPLNNILIFLVLCLTWINTIQNLTFSKTHLLGFTTENKLLERIYNRIESHPNFNPKNFYVMIQAGERPARNRYYNNPYSTASGYYTLKVPFSRHWVAFEYYNFYAPHNFINGDPIIHPQDITPTMQDYLRHRISSWPSTDSLYLDNKYILFALTPQGKDLLTTQFNLLGRY